MVRHNQPSPYVYERTCCCEQRQRIAVVITSNPLDFHFEFFHYSLTIVVIPMINVALLSSFMYPYATRFVIVNPLS